MKSSNILYIVLYYTDMDFRKKNSQYFESRKANLLEGVIF